MRWNIVIISMILFIVGCGGHISKIPQLLSNPKGLPTTTWGKDGAEMVLIPEGTFPMASSRYGCREIYLDAFYIDKYEVTNALFEEFVKATGYQTEAERSKWNITWRTYYTAERKKHPVTCISWDDANAYCKWADKRLPTEAEWEKAARGTDGRRWPWGDVWDASRLNSAETPHHETWATTPVGNYPNGASPYGVLDMAGNAMEWCADWYDVDYYARMPKRNPQGPINGKYHVARGGSWRGGGSWRDVAFFTRATTRLTPLGYRIAEVGFRCALSAHLVEKTMTQTLPNSTVKI
jgi:serine/threonine-protein kinase